MADFAAISDISNINATIGVPSFGPGFASSVTSGLPGKIVNLGCNGTPSFTCGFYPLGQQLALALQYLSLTSTGARLIDALPNPTEIDQTVGGSNHGQRVGTVGFVDWDPFTAFGFTSTKRMVSTPPFGALLPTYDAISPAVALAHELGHTTGLADPVNWQTWEEPIVRQLDALGFNEGHRAYYSTGLTTISVPSALDNGP